LYQNHPVVTEVSLCETDPSVLAKVGDEFGIAKRHLSLDSVLEDPTVDAVHLLTPVPVHVSQSLAVLNSGRHCACAVPIATSLEDLDKVIAAADASGKVYMMMETMVYTREFFYARDIEFGPITFLQADYYQDLEAPYGDYWRYVPPMHYATHAIAPLLAIAKARATSVSCLGAGKLKPSICDSPVNPFPMQTAHFKLEGTDAVAQVNRAWYQTARPYVEAFNIYGELRGFEWQQLEEEEPLVFELPPVQHEIRWRNASATRVCPPLRPELYPASLASHADGGHSGSHPHLVHEFISAIVERREAWINARVAADWTAPGICAHESSLRGGEWVKVPSYAR
jgi:predicted dehydrogenase